MSSLCVLSMLTAFAIAILLFSLAVAAGGACYRFIQNVVWCLKSNSNQVQFFEHVLPIPFCFALCLLTGGGAAGLLIQALTGGCCR